MIGSRLRRKLHPWKISKVCYFGVALISASENATPVKLCSEFLVAEKESLREEFRIRGCSHWLVFTEDSLSVNW